MQISRFTGAPVVDYTKKRVNREDKAEQKKEQKPAASQNRDTFVRTTETDTGIYVRSRVNVKQDVSSLMDEANARYDSFVRMLHSMISKQGEQSNLTLFGMQLHVTPQQSAEAAASIADGGEYSVDAVATRILDMAKALSGGNPEMIATLKNGVIKGFKAAGVDFGGKLPDICSKTYDEVMKRFDDWENETKSAPAE